MPDTDINLHNLIRSGRVIPEEFIVRARSAYSTDLADSGDDTLSDYVILPPDDYLSQYRDLHIEIGIDAAGVPPTPLTLPLAILPDTAGGSALTYGGISSGNLHFTVRYSPTPRQLDILMSGGALKPGITCLALRRPYSWNPGN